MAGSSDVVKKVTRFKEQLADAADSATVLKILRKLKDLNVTLDILAETGIGKTVNTLRRHKQAGELAKSLVKGWKKLVPKESTSTIDDKDVSESVTFKDKLDEHIRPRTGSLTQDDLNNNCLTSHSKSQDSSDEANFKTGKRKAAAERQQCEERTESQEKDQQENQKIFKYEVFTKKVKTQEVKQDDSVTKKKKNNHNDRKPRDSCHEIKNSEHTQKSGCDDKEILKSNSESGTCGSEKSNRKSKPSKAVKESFLSDPSDKLESKMVKLVNVTDERCSGMSGSSEARDKKRKRSGTERKEDKQQSENKDHLKHKNQKAQVKHRDPDPQEPSMSFESFLNYDVNVSKRKQRHVKSHKKMKNDATKNAAVKSFKSPVPSVHVTSPGQKSQGSLMDLMSIPLPASLLECEKPFSFEYFEKRVEKVPELCDAPEESAIFTCQRLNKKMQVYSGAKTIFLPTMMSLYQQCIRTLQNNINMLYETGGVPFEILEPVLERCTPEQLIRIEECNPIYIGVTDHLWRRHCQRDFKDSKMQEYESWKEMYIRLSDERERKLQRLTKSIVSAHSKKPKGRQVKMAFIHSVAKPPRDVRIQQEMNGTAVQQPHQKCSVKAPDNSSRQSCKELSRSSSTASGSSNTQDPRKKTRVAPMMAKSLKAFKKLGRR